MCLFSWPCFGLVWVGSGRVGSGLGWVGLVGAIIEPPAVSSGPAGSCRGERSTRAKRKGGPSRSFSAQNVRPLVAGLKGNSRKTTLLGVSIYFNFVLFPDTLFSTQTGWVASICFWKAAPKTRS